MNKMNNHHTFDRKPIECTMNLNNLQWKERALYGASDNVSY